MLCIKNSTWKSFSGNEKKDESASGIKRNTISRPTAYGEYAPYTFIENEEEFEKLVEKRVVSKRGYQLLPIENRICDDTEINHSKTTDF